MIRRTTYILLLSLFLWLWLPSLGASAAQNARVLVDTAVIREAPEDDAHGVGQATRDQIIRVSSVSHDQWYKTVVPGTEASPQYGWIHAEDIVPLPLERELQNSKIQSGPTLVDNMEEVEDRRSRWSLIPFVQYNEFNSGLGDLQSAVGSNPSMVNLINPGIEISLRPNTYAGVGVYILPYVHTSDANFTLTSLAFVALVPEWYAVYSDSHRIAVGLGLGAAPLQIGPGSSGVGSSIPTFVSPLVFLRGTYTLNFTGGVGLRLGGGYRYLAASKVPVAYLLPNPAGQTIRINLSGLFLDAGLSIDL